jgi:ribosomal protein S27E
MNIFLQPFCIKLKECFNNDINWVHPKTNIKCTSKIVVPLIVADTPGRAAIQNTHNFNGRYDCNMCEIKTQKCEKSEGKRRIRIYPFNNLGAALRTAK